MLWGESFMKWSYTNGKLNVSSDETDQQFLLKELIEEASRHQAYQKKIISLFVILSLLLFFMQSYGGDLPTNASTYFFSFHYLYSVMQNILRIYKSKEWLMEIPYILFMETKSLK